MSVTSGDGLDNQTYLARADLGARFEFGRLPRGSYLLFPHLGLIITSILSEGAPIRGDQITLDEPVDRIVTITVGTGAGLYGLIDLHGTPSTEASLFVFPQDEELWSGYGSRPSRLIEVRPGSDGRYSVGGIPPGNYHVVALAHGVENWRSPEQLRKLREGARGIRLANADSFEIDFIAR
jgi:hypothetical protein